MAVDNGETLHIIRQWMSYYEGPDIYGIIITLITHILHVPISVQKKNKSKKKMLQAKKSYKILNSLAAKIST